MALVTQAFKMKLDCLAHILFNFLFGRARSNAPIKVGRIRRIPGSRFFNNNQILHSLLLCPLSLRPQGGDPLTDRKAASLRP